MKLVRHIETIENRGYLFEFTIDVNSPDEPELSRARRYYVVATDPSPSRAFCYLSIYFRDPSLYSPKSRWFSLHNRVFGPIGHDRFVGELLKVSQAEAESYSLFTDEPAARAALGVISTNRVDPTGGRAARGGDAHGSPFETPRDVKTAAAVQILSENVKARLGKGVETLLGPPYTVSKEAMTSTRDADFQSQGNQLREARQLLQLERNQHEKDVEHLMSEISQLHKQLKNVGYEGKGRQQEQQTTTLRDSQERERLLQLTIDENVLLKQRYHHACVELEHWRMECRRLKHKCDQKAMASTQATKCVSQEEYNDLEKRHRLLHKELHELSEEKMELESRLRKADEEATRRSMELRLALQALHSLGRGLDNVQHKLPLVLRSE
ncbi:hypothetical protein, conserved [Trypanosoma brucei gambiense DAL972]|uniref:Uncharacterized protein n=2 Tax=Trypanosoma brucei TaxID=5691 RepID=C9ZZ77_TRYB9|nr:hypothetical protein, conserved [Trypanosoma brucei gambiense DAL972]RHW70194.1 Microtubule-associated protein Bicaudal-D [Trypanosoma brucei equiperdum]CBH14726.1 hypothetical protein, conserved [Trypanosoma brucei gambiense DAL972]|eukprot:XP_011776992.1 hypothetical protein, conserved [Trypanosoma brucei gambiense DAL972]